MQFSNLVNDGLVQTLNRLTGASTTANYPFKNKCTDLNEALDWYCSLAFKAGLAWEFDDINQTNPPIDTQNIVSGTNRYKISAFAEKILDLVRLEILTSTGKGQMLYPETFDSLGNPLIGATSGVVAWGVNNTFQELYINAPSGTPTNYCKFGDFIYLRPNPNYNSTAGLKAYFNRTALKFNFVPVTVNAGTDIFTGANSFVAGDTVIFETDGTIPTGLTADTQYYVIAANLSATQFQVSTTSGGSALDVTNAQTGSNHAFLQTSGSPGIPVPHHIMLCRRAALTYLNYSNSFKIGNLPQQVAQDEQTIKDYFAMRGKDLKKILMPGFQDNR